MFIKKPLNRRTNFECFINVNIYDLKLMTEIIIVILVLILFIVLAIVTIYSRRKEKTNIRPNQTFEQYQEDYVFNDTSYKTDYISDKNVSNTFEQIISLIKNNFHPTSFKNDEDCEKILISFLTEKLPNNIIAQGHTAKGDKLDIVIDGTYALELIVADNEEKLLCLMDLSLKSKEYFDKIAVVIVDVKKIPSSKIQEFAVEFEKIGIKTIIIEANIIEMSC